MYYDYNHGPSYKHHDSYHEPVYKADDKPIVYKPEPAYKPEPTYNWSITNVWRFSQTSGRNDQSHVKSFDSTRILPVLT